MLRYSSKFSYAAISLVSGMILAAPASIRLAAQSTSGAGSVLQQHYDRAQALQGSGDLEGAARQYRIFIADALGEMALQAANLNLYGKAAPLFDEALRLAPNSPGLKVRYAQAAYAAQDYARTRTLGEAILRDFPGNVQADAKAHLLLGRALQRMNQESAARAHFEAAVALDPSFEDGFALAVVLLDLDDDKGAAKVFAEMIAGLGESAALRLEIGRAYLQSDFQPSALPQLQRAIALDARLPGAHGALAAAYMASGGDDGLTLARHELEAELAISPGSAAAHAQMGNLDLRQHRTAEAEAELKRALALDPKNVEGHMYLGQLYSETDRGAEAIAALRQAIALTADPAANRFQIQKAHYLLGRLLTRSGDDAAAKQEMQISAALLKQSLGKDRDRLAGSFAPAPAAASTGPGSADGAQTPGGKALDDFERRLAPALADSYNNLGVIAAGERQYEDALTSFQRASQWNPRVEGLDANWGRAALLGGKYDEAIRALSRSLHSVPENAAVQAELASAYYLKGSGELEQGDLPAATANLEQAAKLAPDNKDTHRALAVAYRRAKREDAATREDAILKALGEGSLSQAVPGRP